jgi:hypothetical protein
VLLTPKQREPIVERLLVDPIGADGGRESAGDFRERLRLTDIQPDDECRVAYGQDEAEHADRPILHPHEHVTGR